MDITLSGKHFILDPSIGTSPFRVESGKVADGEAAVTLHFAGDDILSGVVGATIHHPGGHIQSLVPQNPGQVATIQTDESGYGPGYFVFNASVLVDSVHGSKLFDRVLVLTHGEWPGYFPFTPETPTPCLCGESYILLPHGQLRRAKLISAGDMVMTANGPKEVKYVTERKVTGAEMRKNKKLRPILIPGPFSSIIVSRQHRLAINVGKPEDLADVPNLVSAIHIHRHFGGKGDGTEILMMDEDITYINLWFEEHEIIFANGIAVESGWLGGKRAQDLIGAIDWHKVSDYLEKHEQPALPIWSPKKE